MAVHNPNGIPALQFIVATLPGHPDIGLLRAAARRGAIAILNLEAVQNPDSPVAALVRGKVGQVGVRLDSRQTLERISRELVSALDAVVCTPAALAQGGVEALQPLLSPACLILLECVSVEDVGAAHGLNVAGLIAKGHEAGGRVGEETTFVLVQRLLAHESLPVWAHGGVGTHTAAACFAAGCAGVVLDAQLILARESAAPEAVKSAVERMTGDETICLGSELNDRYRVFRRPGLDGIQDLQRVEAELAREQAGESRTRRWREAIRSAVAWGTAGGALWPLGQDAAFAAGLSSRFRSVAGILQGLHDAVAAHLAIARAACPLDRHAALAQAHGTTFPILQGPMTRVSDTAAFAAAVATGGGLPFLALALLRAPQVRALLRETSGLLGDRPWGVGILGFVPLELRQEQLAVVEEFRPPFAIIAGGRPDQAATLERLGTATYLHVPAPALLKMFVDGGSRRFIFEGRECGGHVGPRTSFVLWQLAVDTLLDAVARGVPATELHVVFAGGIHDGRSAAMVAAIAAPLVEAGVRVGVLLGTAYLFTEEAVQAGAIVDTFQQEALKCAHTVLLESGPGHATRCAENPFAETFRHERRQLAADGRNPEDIRLRLETLNLGRLRIASKGIKRANDAPPSDGGHVKVDSDEQRRDGMYMIGQVAALRERVCRIADLHEDVSAGSSARLRAAIVPRTEAPAVVTSAVSSRVAIVGLGCLLPKAPDVSTLWRNVLTGVDAIREVPAERFDVNIYFDSDRRARDRIYSKWGGFLDEVAFDPLKYGIPPSAVPSIDPFQLLTLEVVDQALRDAGYTHRPFNRERTSVILGASGGVGDLGFRYGIRAGLPMYLDHVSEDVYKRLPEWTEDSFAGVLLNVAAGRVANRLDLGGLNFTVDAACASSLAAVFLAARELETHSSDMVLVGGIDTVNSPFGYLCFSSAQALSPRGRCSTFDQSADGIAISEGLTMLVLKRAEDAERDGDRIYAVIRAVAGSSDGRGKGLTAPRPEGQMRVLERAYAAAGVSPATIGLVEAHGTGTVAGDGAEVTALSRVFTAAGAAPLGCALGSIKSMIGHTKSAAGVSGLLKVALALHHKVLPPTLHVTKPNARLRDEATPFYVNTEARPWIAPGDEPRRGGVSSFGFGGTNFHVVVEEHGAQSAGAVPDVAAIDDWPAELAVWSTSSAADLIAALERAEQALAQAPSVPLRIVAAAVCRAGSGPARTGDLRLAIVAENVADLRKKAVAARTALEAGRTAFNGVEGVYGGVVQEAGSNLAFVFPGQGSQYPGMHRELAVHFPDIRHAMEEADRVTAGAFPRRLSSYVFPPPAFGKAEEEARMRELTDTAIAQPALGAMETGLLWLLDRLGIRPSFTAGHSYGEYVALMAAGVFPAETLFTLSAARGRFMSRASGERAGAMAAVGAAPDAIRHALPSDLQFWVANVNTPRQTVIAGSCDAIDKAIELLSGAGLTARRIDVSCAFHSPLVEPAHREMAALLAQTAIKPPQMPVFSNSLALPYPCHADEIRQVLSDHIVRPVRFVEQIENMYAAGARVFLEVGPRSVLTNLIRETLRGRDVRCLALNTRDGREIPNLLTVLAQLAALGASIEFEVLWRGRSIPMVRIGDLAQAAPPAPPAHAWWVNGGGARRAGQSGKGAVTPATRGSVPVPASDSPASAPPSSTSPATPASQPARDRAAHSTAKLQQSVRVAVPPLLKAQETTNVSSGGTMHAPRLSQHEIRTGGHDAVMHQFQQLMSQFLQTQALVMTTYFQGVSNGEGALTAMPRGLPSAPALAAATASPILPATMVGGAALQASTRASASPVQTVLPTSAPSSTATAAQGAVQFSDPVMRRGDVPTPPAVSPATTATASTPGVEGSTVAPLTEPAVLSRLVRIVSDRTGYPEEMLSVDANMEADLGIDSIKRIEILAAFQEAHSGGEHASFQQALERLTALKTLRESAAALTEILAAPAPAAATV